MLLQAGDRLLVTHRRLFPDDAPRFFLGVVDQCDHDLVLVTGHSWVRSPVLGEFHKKADLRSKVVALGSGTIMVYQLPHELDLDLLEIVKRDKNQSFLTDKKGFEMDITDYHYVKG